jgi:hypothetical protein
MHLPNLNGPLPSVVMKGSTDRNTESQDLLVMKHPRFLETDFPGLDRNRALLEWGYQLQDAALDSKGHIRDLNLFGKSIKVRQAALFALWKDRLRKDAAAARELATTAATQPEKKSDPRQRS